MNGIRKGSMYLALFLAFLLGSHKGYIALWKNGSPEPVRIFPYRVTSLPPADQQALEQGISVDSRQELVQLLEDYLS